MSRDPSLNLQNFFSQSQDVPINDKWDTLWHNDTTPWDRGIPSPALVELLVDKHFPIAPAGKAVKALVPGCGRGYDVALFAGLEPVEKAVGLDVSSKALEEARKIQKESAGKIEFVKGDFFSKTEDWATSGPYDVVYDYTFLCALQPDMRPQWAKRMAEIITPGTGLLIALQHPITPEHFHSEDLKRGPPFLYEELLGENFERVYFEKPTKFHKVGATDMMSVYRRRA